MRYAPKAQSFDRFLQLLAGFESRAHGGNVHGLFSVAHPKKKSRRKIPATQLFTANATQTSVAQPLEFSGAASRIC